MEGGPPCDIIGLYNSGEGEPKRVLYKASIPTIDTAHSMEGVAGSFSTPQGLQAFSSRPLEDSRRDCVMFHISSFTKRHSSNGYEASIMFRLLIANQ